MRTPKNTHKNPTAPSSPAIQPPWRVYSVEALANFRLKVRFVDGTEGIVDLSKLVLAPSAGALAALAEPSLFEQVFVEDGAVTWPGEIDLAPEAMYDRIKQSSSPVIYE